MIIDVINSIRTNLAIISNRLARVAVRTLIPIAAGIIALGTLYGDPFIGIIGAGVWASFVLWAVGFNRVYSFKEPTRTPPDPNQADTELGRVKAQYVQGELTEDELEAQIGRAIGDGEGDGAETKGADDSSAEDRVGNTVRAEVVYTDPNGSQVVIGRADVELGEPGDLRESEIDVHWQLE